VAGGEGGRVPADVFASPLAERPYDLRHAAVSTWLNGGAPATTVAEWAGHSVDVLLRIYAKCLDGGTDALRKRVVEVLSEGQVHGDRANGQGDNDEGGPIR
jgi:integrase